VQTQPQWTQWPRPSWDSRRHICRTSLWPEKHGLGVADPDVIWIRGNDIDEARHIFAKPTGFSG